MESRRRWQLKLLLAPYPGLTKIHMEKESFPVRGIIYFMADCPLFVYPSFHPSSHLFILFIHTYMYTYVHDVEGISTYISSSVILKTGDYHVFLNLELGRQIMPDPYPPLHN
jgi:hypothetical protein